MTRRSIARCSAVDSSLNEADRLKAYHDFEKRWYDIQPMTILFYPQDVVAVNPKLSGFDATTYTPTFYPQPEHWTIEGAGADATAAFASWQPPSSLIPMYSIGYSEFERLRPRLQPSLRIRQLGGQDARPLARRPATPCPTTASIGW